MKVCAQWPPFVLQLLLFQAFRTMCLQHSDIVAFTRRTHLATEQSVLAGFTDFVAEDP